MLSVVTLLNFIMVPAHFIALDFQVKMYDFGTNNSPSNQRELHKNILQFSYG